MKHLFLFMIILINSQALALEDDKHYHLLSSAFLGSQFYEQTEDRMLSFTSCSLIGLGKEVMDEIDYGGADYKDVIANSVGCYLGVRLGDNAYLTPDALTFIFRF